MLTLFIYLSTILQQPSLLGVWGKTSDLEYEECGDQLVFSSDNKLTFLNECYGDTSDEIGTANYFIQNDSIKLSSIKFKTNYSSFIDNEFKMLKYSLTIDTLYLTVYSDRMQTEKYIKVT